MLSGLEQRSTLSFSVIITSFERPLFLLESLTSVLSQELAPVEIIVVNDSPSFDYSACETLLSNPLCKTLFTQGQEGANRARNIGLSEAKGDIVAFLDDDDVWFPSYLRRISEVYQAFSNVSSTVCGKQILGSELISVNKANYVSDAELKKGNTFCGFSGFTCEAELLKKHCLDESLSNAQDWDLYIRLLCSGALIKNIPEPLFFYRAMVESGITYKNHIYNEKNASLILKASIKHKEWLGEQAFRRRVSWMTLNNLKRKQHKLKWLALCAKHIGYWETLKAILIKTKHMEKS
ncbi:glycosyltransferase family 2 protein [Glaciecola sp. MH2013]|uniref:glycosyltransferase family 2 protein n=1 Tax=Glaciecola sp. MH2013 TaxID=2785524 RepID=UPI00189D1615|nr:glycosyltransferase family 2 protein [Glaciecola sp. MH2013]MBF7074873.1 glycosyltransferase family 2 protein [Glaciecola sp. MH2013]